VGVKEAKKYDCTVWEWEKSWRGKTSHIGVVGIRGKIGGGMTSLGKGSSG